MFDYTFASFGLIITNNLENAVVDGDSFNLKNTDKTVIHALTFANVIWMNRLDDGYTIALMLCLKGVSKIVTSNYN